MIGRPLLGVAGTLLAVCLSGPLFLPDARALTETLLPKLSDEEFWQVALSLSERPGTFQSDNLLSNERWLQHVIPELKQRAAPSRVYLGVGPEQNFTYILAVKPALAFIIDIRRGNFDLHLMYKALFELSTDRADFVARLFSRERPEGLNATSTLANIFDAYAEIEPSEALYAQNMRAIVNHLAKKHRFELSADDMLRLQHIYRAFYRFGPEIQYSSTRSVSGRRPNEPTYRDLMVATDRVGQLHGYLSSEEAFGYLKKLESENRLVPLIGNFVGPKTVRALGEYLTGKGAVVSAFYVSNVEEYLRQDGTWPEFCANVATLPIDDISVFIRSVRGRTSNSGTGLIAELGAMRDEVRPCKAE